MTKSRTKSFVGGIVIGLLVGLICGGFTVAVIGGSAFINFEMGKHSVILPAIIK